MAFDVKVKILAKRKSAFRCCICYKPFVEVHHIIPQNDDGPDTLDNAAPLCASCHDLYGGNPEKRKIIREMRDHWWKIVEKREKTLTHQPNLDLVCEIDEIPLATLPTKAVPIYHVVLEKESFETAAEHIHELIVHTQKNFPNCRRILFLDIIGHRNGNDGFDQDMNELQRHFILGFLFQYLSELSIPLGHAKNTNPQRNDVPDIIEVSKGSESGILSDAIDRNLSAIWLGNRDKEINLD